MKRVYSTRTELDAHQARLFLESHGISSVVVGESAAFTNLSFTPTSEPGVSVEEVNFERAALLMQEYSSVEGENVRRGDWVCSKCGEPGEASFDLCWKCETPRPPDAAAVFADTSISNAPDVAAANQSAPVDSPAVLAQQEASEVIYAGRLIERSKSRLWFEVLLILAISQPYLVEGWLFSLFEDFWPERTFASQSAFIFMLESAVAACTLLIIACSGEPWSKFGIKRPQMLWDLFGAGILYLIAVRAVSMSNGLFLDALQEWLPREDFHRLVNLPSEWIPPHGGGDLVLALITCLAIGFSEELVYRGFLIPRFERLLGSTALSVIVSSLLFASIHFSGNGILGVWNALGFGLIAGFVFARFRQLWPLVFAHGLADFVLFIQSVDA